MFFFFLMYLKEFKPLFDKHLKDYIKKKIKNSKKILTRTRLQSMIEYIETFTFSGGKRVRPYLTYLAYKTCGGHQDDQIMSFSKSLELLHTMALVHDDIIDQGEKRHGVACYHKFIATHVKGKNADHIGESQALLVGDLMLSRVYEVLNDMYQFSSQSLVNAKQNMQETIEEVILGQMIDVDMMVGDEIDLEKLEAKNHYKS